MNIHRYREKFSLSVEQFIREPATDVLLAFAIWDAEASRDKLEENRRKLESKRRGK